MSTTASWRARAQARSAEHTSSVRCGIDSVMALIGSTSAGERGTSRTVGSDMVRLTRKGEGPRTEQTHHPHRRTLQTASRQAKNTESGGQPSLPLGLSDSAGWCEAPEQTLV